ncbi:MULTISPECIES: ABCB family ABC transporter ATP-binding protein/permease [Aliiglaciecola]|uniref:ABCB family ABC transporter ATP-binding protein/permease n=1 Tax=Aliiglaciecola TaxID=1406885 RepID=UPI001C08BE4D|nr:MULTISPECIES: ABC transporter ATP-binding protein/permease [Aliiglaciecola]MBU2877126.1 ABC transporter ATP-binding protein/permease [Aliiglaciecola lipolytica]MDO6710155.1 ABC transporter ATP-binding protein/permease [Aliiglaciecola sp. 2_MG-2023]MDO6751303.1 ABC transporter ATP-binding protein/permease [Aliiglaciecola sp. 1_MG-2023]
MRSRRIPIDPDTPVNWLVLKQLWPYLLEFKQRVLLAFLCLVAAKVASVGLPFVLKHTVDSLNSKTEQLILAPIALIIAYGTLRLANVLFGEIRDTLFGRVTERAMRRVGLRVFEHLHSLDLDFHLNRQTGGLTRDIERGTSGISFLMRFMVFNIGPTLIEIAMVVGLLFYNYGFNFAIVILLSVVFYVIFSMKATDWRTKYVREVNLADSSTNTRAIDSLLNYETVKYFNNEAYEAERYDKDLAGWESARRKNRLSLFALNGGQALIIAIAMTAMMAMAAYGVADGVMTIGDFVLINAFTMQIFMPLNFLGFVYREIRGSLANIENLFALLGKSPEVKNNHKDNDLKVSGAQITFSNVGFCYNNDRPILNNLSFSIDAGKKIAVVGESGAGKSTIVKLLFRFYDVTTGKILIDNQDISQVSQQSLRKAIGIVPQDTVLFNDSIFENVRYGRPTASDDEVQQAIDLAHLRKFVDSLPKGAETQVGERGLKLSGGEKQRVAIARTILKKPPILVFDEATSSLDSQSEKAILDAIKEVSQGHTSVVIAHRLSTIIDADKIVVVDNGAVVEQGTHSELLNQNGLYKKLWDTQQNSEHHD